MPFVIYSCKAGKCWNQNVFLQIYKILSDFDSNPLIWDPTLFPGKNSLNIAKSNRVFPENGRGDRALVLTYLDSPMAEVFPHYYLSFSISAIFRVKRVVTVGPKMQTLGPSVFHENSNPSDFFQIMFWFARVLTLVRISTRRRVRAQRTSKKGHFMDAKSVRKTLKTFNLTTTNAILMKLTTIMYLHESVNWKLLRARNSVFWRNVYESLKTTTYSMHYLALHHWYSFCTIPWKATQNSSQMMLR